MKADKWTVILCLFACKLINAAPTSQSASKLDMPFVELVTMCAPEIHPTTFNGIVATESSFNPYAIGVVGAKIERSPNSKQEAIATAKSLEKLGYNFSLGLTQVNRYNLAYVGESYDTIFEPCRNIKAGATILKDCYSRANTKFRDEQEALRAAFSCYYSGDFTRGFKPDRKGEPSYVQKVVDKALNKKNETIRVPAVEKLASDDSSDKTTPLTSSSKINATMPELAWGFYDGELSNNKGNENKGKENANPTRPTPSWGIFEDQMFSENEKSGSDLSPILVQKRSERDIHPKYVNDLTDE